MVVALRGTSNGVATSIDDELVGPVDEIDHDQSFIKVNGQIVTITPDTIIDDFIIEAFRSNGEELANDLRFGDIDDTTLQQLLSATPTVEVQLNGDVALSIEDL